MILIISSDNDITTNDVIDWLAHYKVPFCRINNTTPVLVKNITIEGNNTDFELDLSMTDGKVLSLKYTEIKSVWFRRGKINIWRNNFNEKRINHDKNEVINAYLLREQLQVESFINYMLSKKVCLNSIFDEPNTNKLKNLVVATECGLITPFTYVTSKKSELLNLLSNENNQFITKPIKFGNIEFKNGSIGAATTMIANDDDNNLIADTFFPSLFQRYIDKKWEIRTFYLDKKLYSTAVFSQSNEKTKVDFRNYDEKKPNRVTPFSLPPDIERKIILLMEKLGLNSGSLDLIYTPQKQFVFLEVNPVGQFNQVSVPANYYLEKEVAKFLINEQ